MDRVTVPALDDVMKHPISVLDDGFVRLVDYMGNDAAVVQAARVVWRWNESGERRRQYHSLPDASSTHDFIRDGRNQTARTCADGCLATPEPLMSTSTRPAIP